ncbi:MAG TPA: hypothetical protein VD794_04480 [Flavisolibacter sp.]|nr:hypothetical protein [Flavisolibacter sp.]
MKKSLVGIAIIMVFLSCSNEPTTTESSPNLTNVQNVNGNMPDTSSSIALDNKKTEDSIKVDSLRNKPKR